jgi:hypothetical protein
MERAHPSLGIRLARRAGSLHRWLALLIGVQILFWFGSGLFMSVVPIEIVRGEHLKAEAPPALDPGALSAGIASALATLGPGPVERIELRTMLGRPVLLVHGQGAPASLHDAGTGARLSPIPAATARAIATADFAGEGSAVSVAWVTTETPEYRGPLPAWRVQFDDREATRLYVPANEGRVAARRTRTWRVYDFLWSLHIMDWTHHEDINNNWLRVVSAVALLLALSGAVLVPWRMGWLRRRKG